MLNEQLQRIRATTQGLRDRGLPLPVEDIVLFRSLVVIGRRLAQAAEDAIRPFALSEPEFRVLTELYARPDGVANPSELCAGAGQSPAGMTRTTDALLHRGLITRTLSEQDRRRMILRITPSGEELLQRMLPSAFAHFRTLFSACPADSRAQLLARLLELAEAFDASEPAFTSAPASAPTSASTAGS